jgi:hypothetical protein
MTDGVSLLACTCVTVCGRNISLAPQFSKESSVAEIKITEVLTSLSNYGILTDDNIRNTNIAV